jgi:NAD(P)-dependent dehydrogenase (short-subunit alcohol dehydrogenase family)
MSVKDLDGRRCFITGAASGIGRATAIAAAGKGAEVFITDIDEAGLERAAREIRDRGGRVGHAAPADVADHDQVVALADAIHRGRGSMDVVMNVAGVSTWGPIERLRHSDWRKMIDVNLMGPISVLECFVPPMIEAGRGGHIVNVSSSAGLFGFPWHAAYSASKFGLRGISEVLRFDLRRHDIGVTLVCPGAVRTGLVETVDIVGVDREHPSVKKLVKVFERRAVTPESVAEKIIRGIERDRYLVFTSRDIQFGHWVQRKFAPPYDLAMRVMNDRLTAVGERAMKPDGATGERTRSRGRSSV